jgi:hypothetical protein
MVLDSMLTGFICGLQSPGAAATVHYLGCAHSDIQAALPGKVEVLTR